MSMKNANPRLSNPAKYWRKVICQDWEPLHSPPAGVDPDEYYRTFMNDIYTKEQHRREEHIAHSAPGADMKGENTVFFVFGLGLLTYGRLDVVEDIINNIPRNPSAQNVRSLIAALKAIVPIPAELDPRNDPEAVKKWFGKNRAKLKWNEKNGMFVFDTI